MVILNVFVLSDVDKSLLHLNWVGYREFVADSVIQATGTVEFEDGSPPWRLLGPLERPNLA